MSDRPAPMPPLLSDEDARKLREAEYWKTPEGRAVKRWPADRSIDGRTNLTLTKRNVRQGYARCIREEVEPLEADLAQSLATINDLRKAAQVAADALARFGLGDSLAASHPHLSNYTYFDEKTWHDRRAALTTLRDAGITPKP